MLFYLILFSSTFFSIFHLVSSYKYRDRKALYKVNQKGMSILVPCYNEALILRYTVEGLLNVEYDDLEIIFINDGSIDDTFQALYELLDLSRWDIKISDILANKVKGVYKSNKYPFMYVIDKYKSGKANSLNIGALYAKNKLIVTMDGDCVLEKNALAKMNTAFDDENVIASGGVVHIMQLFKLDSKPGLVTLMQGLDYIKGFYIYKASLAYNEALTIISGAFGVFRKDIIMEIGGFRAGLGEDIDITLRLQEYAKKHDKKVVFMRNAICYTECPESLPELVKQRVRWQKGFISAVLSNSSFLFKNIFNSNLCFIIIIDALLSNSFATVVFIINAILVFIKLTYGFPLNLFAYYLTTVIFNIFYSVIAIKSAKRNTPTLKTRPLYLMIIFDMVFFQFLRIFFFLEGVLTFYFDNKYWYKVVRTNNCYKV